MVMVGRVQVEHSGLGLWFHRKPKERLCIEMVSVTLSKTCKWAWACMPKSLHYNKFVYIYIERERYASTMQYTQVLVNVFWAPKVPCSDLCLEGRGT